MRSGRGNGRGEERNGVRRTYSTRYSTGVGDGGDDLFPPWIHARVCRSAICSLQSAADQSRAKSPLPPVAIPSPLDDPGLVVKQKKKTCGPGRPQVFGKYGGTSVL
jgi:hypothetical protein